MKNLKIFTNNIEDSAKQQVDLLMSQEAFANSKVRIMPDVHAGKGCVIGFTGDLGDKVIPNIVGVDIGCGMLCVKLREQHINLKQVDEIIREYIPSGMNVSDTEGGKDIIDELICTDKLRNKESWLYKSLGTLGGGNHFIEIDQDESGNKYLIIHTGSRNIGKQVAEIYQDMAIKHCSYETEKRNKIKSTINYLSIRGKRSEIENAIKEIESEYVGMSKLPKELCYLEGKEKNEYLSDMRLCIEYAKRNRVLIAQIIMDKLGVGWCETFHTIHNYIDDDGMVRKGAVSARYGEKLLIPLNMRDGCILAVGKGNEDWNYSAPHGAGRIMSRTEAKRKIAYEDYQDAMNGIYTSSVSKGTLDEAPMAYKPMQEIIEYIGDTVEIVGILKPIYNFKAEDGK